MPQTPPHIGTTEDQAVGLPPVGQMLHSCKGAVSLEAFVATHTNGPPRQFAARNLRC